MAVADGDFIDGEVLEMLEFGFAESCLQMAFEEVFDGVPADVKMLGDGLDGHVGKQVESILFKCEREASMGIGDGDVGLSNELAIVASESRHGELQLDRFTADGHGAIGARVDAASDDVAGSARRAAIVLRILFEVDGDDLVGANGLCDAV